MTLAVRETSRFENIRPDEIWQQYCGFLDLSLEQFMEIQSYLLREQVREISKTPLGNHILKGAWPKTTESFRTQIPLTKYDDYRQFLGARDEDALSEDTLFWCHSAGRGGDFKWIPYTRTAFDRIAKHGIAVAILAAADAKNDVRLRPHDKALVNLAPRPYASGSFLHHLAEYLPYKAIPSLDQAENLDFPTRTRLAFDIALDVGLDYIFSVSTVLMKIGESFADREKGMEFSARYLRPGVLRRVANAMLHSRVARRHMLPKDLWSLKGLITFGVDTAIYEDKIEEMWGRKPYQVYGTTEMLIGAVQSWNKKGLSFLPDVAFWEFIPKAELEREREDPTYQPKTVLMNELRPGEQYELVYTHFWGMPLLRYRSGDVFKVTALNDPETGVQVPQVIFEARANEIIDLAGLTQIDERTLWQAIEDTGIPYEDWCARKEFLEDRGYLRVFLEPKSDVPAEHVEELLEEQLRSRDVDYRDLEGWLGQSRSIAVTLLPPGTFRRYSRMQLEQGAAVTKLKPPHINPTEQSLLQLLERSQERTPILAR